MIIYIYKYIYIYIMGAHIEPCDQTVLPGNTIGLKISGHSTSPHIGTTTVEIECPHPSPPVRNKGIHKIVSVPTSSMMSSQILCCC